MRALAEFVMKGRKQSIIAVVLLGLLPMVNFLSPAVIGLIVLRKGWQEAAQVLIWAILPLAAWAMTGNVVPLILLLGVSGLAVLLRETESWEIALLVAIVVGASVEVYVRAAPLLLDTIMQQFEMYLEVNNLQGIQVEEVRELLTSFIGAVYMFLAILLLMLSRWMQAALYNPGGFKTEFHGLRIEQKIALTLLGLMLVVNYVGGIPGGWVFYLVLPLIFSGLALVHAVVAKKKLPSMFLAAFYALLMFPVVLYLVVMLALVDSWYNFRSRIA